MDRWIDIDIDIDIYAYTYVRPCSGGMPQRARVGESTLNNINCILYVYVCILDMLVCMLPSEISRAVGWDSRRLA